MKKPILLKPASVGDGSGGDVVLSMKDDNNNDYEMRMPTIVCQSIIQGLSTCLAEAPKRPKFENSASYEFGRMQLEEIGEKLYVRLFLSPEMFHEYWLPLNTTLAQALLDALEALNLSKTTHSGPGRPN
ncbi:MAG: hypothetical protein WC807_21080 [Hyphomicrobium sp.]|jgi:hypothetical protein